MGQRNFIYVPQRNIAFAYVPKVACTNWKCLMRYFAGHEDWLDTEKAHDSKKSGLKYFDPRNDRHRLLSRRGIQVFTMLRDPRTRALSAYFDKVQRYVPKLDNPGERGWSRMTADIDAFRKSFLPQDAYPEICFEVFLRWLRDSGHRKVPDEHWLPQVELLRHGRIHFDFVGRFENIAEDSRRILDAIGADISFPSHEKVNFPSMGTKSRYAEHMTPQCEELLRDLYQADFEAYGY